ncbi:MAG: hemerythrin family protein [Firmicutes bacterium]|nr:hemerythrin family protein [Bacillota bacterium]
MWQDAFSIGVEHIDNQHKELFAKTGELLDELRANGMNNKDRCITTILFLKDYAIQHFADEEAYQISINYSGFAEHKKLHTQFLQDVLAFEQKMIDSDFAETVVKKFADWLVAWLLYHVVDADKRIK